MRRDLGGAPDETRSAYGIPELAEDLAGLVDGLQLDAFHLVAHSLGGAVALQYALRSTSRACEA